MKHAVAHGTKLLMLGIGGGGCHVVAHMRSRVPEEVRTAIIHSDARALERIEADQALLIGRDLLDGMSAGGDPGMGRRAARIAADEIEQWLRDVDMVFIVVGLGGGTGSGAAPVIAEIAGRLGVLNLCFATTPFAFEGPERMVCAEAAIRELREASDVLITIPNERIIEMIEDRTSINEAFAKVDDVVVESVHALWHLLADTGFMKVDFADVRNTVLHGNGTCALAFGAAKGAGRAHEAVRDALDNPLLEGGHLVREADALLVGIVGGSDMTMMEVKDVMSEVREVARADCRIQMGTAIGDDWGGRLGVVILASEPLSDGVRTESPSVPITDPPTLPEKRKRPAPKSAEPGGKRRAPQIEQTTLELNPPDQGRFKGAVATIYDGEDLDIPTFIRRGIKLTH